MTVLDYVAWGVLIVILAAAVVLMLFLGALPGRIAESRNHPSAEAVRVAGWVGLFLGGVLWPLALIWAYVDVPHSKPGGTAP